ncbi:MAG: 16S rRNA (guanine(966)-N(2))-methyltransferase RsmD [Verrucomicrobia bacterium]|nr:16S rRNA (guanine(966)-N(2))-methyltransferase RsmD [Verrucomicrobiota bacterium]
MRVITGSAGGIQLVTPRGASDVRPTPDRVKGAIFNSLGDAVIAARVLDLYAGSGALGIEALSRGAASATFVDVSRGCAKAIRQNLAAARAEDRATVLEDDVVRALRRVAVEAPFTLVLADPPYAKQPRRASLAQQLLENNDLAAVTAPNGWLVIEHYKSDALTPPAAWRFDRQQRHGDTRVSFFMRAAG